MSKLFGLGFFWMIADLVASHLSPEAAGVVSWIVSIVVFTGLGSMAIAMVRGGDGFDYPGEGLTLAVAGWGVSQGIFHWHLVNPAVVCSTEIHSCGAGGIAAVMAVNLGILAVGMALASIPGVPLLSAIQKLRNQA